MTSSEKTHIATPSTASEMAEQERFVIERKRHGDIQAEKDFISKLDGFMHTASPDEIQKFMAIACKNSPDAQKEFAELQNYCNSKVYEFMKKPEIAGNQRNLEKEHTAEHLAFSKYETTSKVNNISVPTITIEAYVAWEKSNLNPDTLPKFLASEDLSILENSKRKARAELEKQKINIINSWNYPQGWDSAINLHEESFSKQEAAIIAKYRPNAEAFKKSLNTDQGRNLLLNTGKALLESGIKSNIRKNLGLIELERDDKKEVVEEKPITEIYRKTQDLMNKIGSLKERINQDIETMQKQYAAMLLAGGSNTAYEQSLSWVSWRYEGIIQGEIKKYAKDVGIYLISLDPASEVVLNKKRFSLPIGGQNITLDFSQLGNINTSSKKELKTVFEKNFDSIYRDTISEKTFDSVKNAYQHTKDHPLEVGVDIGSIILSGIATVLFMESTANTSVFVAGPVFTATNNAVSAAGYGIIGARRGKDFKKEALSGINITDSDTVGDVFRKKSFELASNTVLFGIFKMTAIMEKSFKDGVSKLAGTTMTPELAQKIAQNPIFRWVEHIGTPILKTTVEATFFTYYIAISGWIDKALQEMVDNGATKEEAMQIMGQEFDKIKNTDTFLEYLTYNIWFIIAVKGGTKIGETGLAKIDRNKFTKLDTLFVTEQKKLEDKGYSFANRPEWGVFIFDPQGHEVNIHNPNLTPFMKVNRDLYKLSLRMNRATQQEADKNIVTPDSGRSAGKTATNPNNLEKKFIDLKKYSEKAEREWLKYTLRDEIIYSWMERAGISDGTGIKEGLMEKSKFSKSEIDSYKEGKIKGKNEAEREAFSKMEMASEKVMKEYYKFSMELLEKWEIALNKLDPIMRSRMLRLFRHGK